MMQRFDDLPIRRRNTRRKSKYHFLTALQNKSSWSMNRLFRLSQCGFSAILPAELRGTEMFVMLFYEVNEIVGNALFLDNLIMLP